MINYYDINHLNINIRYLNFPMNYYLNNQQDFF